MTIQAAFIAALVLCTLLGTSRALPQGQGAPEQLADLPPAGRTNYDVIREGEKVGAHSVAFWHKGDHLAIKTRTDIAVELLGITLYHFHYESEEDWVDGQLMRLISWTNNDGQTLTANLARAGGRIRGTCNGIMLDVSADLLPISVWHPDFVHQSVILDQYRCAQRSIRATDDGIERILVGAQNVAARHYAVSGELQRDVWYSADGQTIQVQLPARDGSKITFVIQTPLQSPTMEQPISNSSSDTRGKARPSERK